MLDSGQFVVSLKDIICLVGADGQRILANKTSPPTGALYRACTSIRQNVSKLSSIVHWLSAGGNELLA